MPPQGQFTSWAAAVRSGYTPLRGKHVSKLGQPEHPSTWAPEQATTTGPGKEVGRRVFDAAACYTGAKRGETDEEAPEELSRATALGKG